MSTNNIKDIFIQKIETPEKYNRIIDETLNNLPQRSSEEKNNFGIFKKVVVATCCIIILATGAVFAKEISNSIKNFFNFNKGIDKAIENGYIENEDTGGINSNNIEISIDNFLMDDFNFSFTTKIITDNEELFNKCNKIKFANIIITDENNNILHCDSEELFSEFCSSNNLDYVYSDYCANFIATEQNSYIKQVSGNEISMVYNLWANAFPKSKNITITIKDIFINNTETNCQKIINGEWSIQIEVPEKFYNRECIVYVVTSCNSSLINIDSFSVYNTCAKLEVSAQFDELCESNETVEVKKEILQELTEYEENNKSSIYIEDEFGNKYYPIKSSSQDNIRVYGIDGKFEYYGTFDLTKYDNASKLKIFFYLDLINVQEDIIIELERKM